MAIVVQDFVQSLISKHLYWNRTQGANHFIVNCDNICRKATIQMRLLENAIQVMCGSLNALEFKPIQVYCPSRSRIHSSTSWKYHIKQETSAFIHSTM
ncbi:xylogalacturonan beta-1 [Quercus suber]|uniref:Xylogalacturonan beta-1 n=1 Tax=Quercus suber TaxID=58331 RepID=A0AAW0M094_QUESU